jgi:hypothetical protein
MDHEEGAPPRRRPSLPYRAAFQTPLDYRAATEHVRGELRTWLRERKLDVERFDAGRVQVGPGSVLRYAATNEATGSGSLSLSCALHLLTSSTA